MGRVPGLVLLGGCVTQVPVAPTQLEPPDIPCLVLDVSSLDFGEVPLGEPAGVETLRLSNPCGASVEVTDVGWVDEAAFEFASLPALPATLQPGDAVEVTVSIEPDGYGIFYDELEIVSTDPSSMMQRVVARLESVCVSVADDVDSDGDAVPDDCDICDGFADNGRDGDGDGVPDICDRCAGFDDADDADDDTVPDACDVCAGFDDRQDADLDGIPDGCDD